MDWSALLASNYRLLKPPRRDRLTVLRLSNRGIRSAKRPAVAGLETLLVGFKEQINQDIEHKRQTGPDESSENDEIHVALARTGYVRNLSTKASGPCLNGT